MATYKELFEKIIPYPNKYELERGIKIIKWIFRVDTPTIKIIYRYMDNGEVGMYIFYKTSRSLNVDNWAFWCPLHNQIEVIEQIPLFYKEVNSYVLQP